MCERTCKVPFRLEKVGDKSMIVVTMNVTSLRQQFDEVLRLPWHVACLQEVRLTAAGQFDMRARFEAACCNIVFGSPQDELTNPWHCKQGGVAIVCRGGVTLQSVSPACEVERELVDSRLFVHAAFDLRDGSRVAHVMCMYGYSGANQSSERMALNEKLLSNSLLVTARLGDVPVMIAGDVNVNPDTSSALQRAVATGRWLDAAHVCAQSQGFVADPTCFVRSTSVGSRIDVIFMNSVMRPMLGEAGALLDSTLPVHCPVASELGLACGKRVVQVMQTPRRIPLGFVDPDIDAEACSSDHVCRKIVALSASAWNKACNCRDVEEMWRLWCRDAEEYLPERATLAGCIVDRRLCSGRGRVKVVKRTIGAAQDSTGAARSFKLNKLGRLKRQLTDLLKQGLRVTTIASQQHLWSKCRKSGVRLLTSRFCADMWNVAETPCTTDLQQLIHCVSLELQRVAAKSCKEREATWKEAFLSDWAEGGSACFSWCKGEFNEG